MNSGFARLVEAREAGRVHFDRIVIGVLYGTDATLTDKFKIAQGIGPHDLVDIRQHVDIRAGRAFWAWLNAGVAETQDWVLDGILKAIEQCRESLGPAADALEAYQESYELQLARHMREDGSVDWHALLREING